jgi:hypothetical protein
MKIILAIGMAISSMAMIAQPSTSHEIKSGSVKGRVMDSVLAQPLPHANMVIKDLSGAVIAGSISAEDGRFTIDKIHNGPSPSS